MLNALCELFQTPFTHVEHLELDHVQAVYATPQQLFAIATFATEEQMEAQWSKASHEVAVKIQGRLGGEHNQLRWDMYLLLLVTDTAVRPEVRKKIENDPRYFRKLVLTAEDQPFSDRLPFRFVVNEQERVLLFEEGQFLQELQTCLSEQARERLGDAFFAGDAPDPDRLLERLRERFEVNGGEADETARG